MEVWQRSRVQGGNLEYDSSIEKECCIFRVSLLFGGNAAKDILGAREFHRERWDVAVQFVTIQNSNNCRYFRIRTWLLRYGM